MAGSNDVTITHVIKDERNSSSRGISTQQLSTILRGFTKEIQKALSDKKSISENIKSLPKKTVSPDEAKIKRENERASRQLQRTLIAATRITPGDTTRRKRAISSFQNAFKDMDRTIDKLSATGRKENDFLRKRIKLFNDLVTLEKSSQTLDKTLPQRRKLASTSDVIKTGALGVFGAAVNTAGSAIDTHAAMMGGLPLTGMGNMGQFFISQQNKIRSQIASGTRMAMSAIGGAIGSEIGTMLGGPFIGTAIGGGVGYLAGTFFTSGTAARNAAIKNVDQLKY